jgi:transcriptional regulator GlxA family with amidase domain
MYSKFSRIDMSKATLWYSMVKIHSDESIKNTQYFIEKNYEQKIALFDITAIWNPNSRSFLRRFKKTTSNTPLEYLQRVRVDNAKKS